MELTIAATLALATQCAPAIAPSTMLSIVSVESRFNPLAIGVNGAPSLSVTATSSADAITKASALIAAGRSIDLGLAQINSLNLPALGLTVAEVFDPCTNLSAAARILHEGYVRSAPDSIGEQPALLTALSYYNTGHPRRGFANGYVSRVTRASARFGPMTISALSTDPVAAPTVLTESPDAMPSPIASAPAWDVFGQIAPDAPFVIRTSARVQTGVFQ